MKVKTPPRFLANQWKKGSVILRVEMSLHNLAADALRAIVRD